MTAVPAVTSLIKSLAASKLLRASKIVKKEETLGKKRPKSFFSCKISQKFSSPPTLNC